MIRALTSMALLALTCAVAACGSIDEERARAEAVRRFSDYSSTFEIDPALFEGPLHAEPPTGARYGFEWRHTDPQGQVSFFVWVESGGVSHVAIDGDIERLKAHPMPPVRS